MIKKIITGAQSGADIAGLQFAIKTDIPCSANINVGFKPLKGKIPKGCEVNIVSEASGTKGLIERRMYNIVNSDFTLIFIDRPLKQTRSSQGTVTDAKKSKKEYTIIKDNRLSKTNILKFQQFCVRKDCILNIAGSRHMDENEVINVLKRLISGDEDMKWFECPVCKDLEETNPGMITHEFPWSVKGRNLFRGHMGSRHPSESVSKAIKKLRKKYDKGGK